MAKPVHYSEHIIVNPEIEGGIPVVKGTRIPVETVLKRLANDLNTKTLVADYPRLTEEDIKACLSYAQDILEEIYPLPQGKQQPYPHL